MRTFDSSSAATRTVGPLEVARWEQYGLGSAMPFDAMWYSVPAGRSSLRDCHPELELSIVLSGTASVETGGTVTELPAGSAFLFDTEEAHIVHNRSDDTPVMIFSAYWMPLESRVAVDAGAAALSTEPSDV
jgi:mannose-6-phosphate isomerase-like protein (cupin superfamily)